MIACAEYHMAEGRGRRKVIKKDEDREAIGDEKFSIVQKGKERRNRRGRADRERLAEVVDRILVWKNCYSAQCLHQCAWQ
jgi:hypothetical protein